MILKLLLIIAVIVGVYFLFFKKSSKNLDKFSNSNDVDDVVECANCQVYSELKDSILSNGKYYCSKECLMEATK